MSHCVVRSKATGVSTAGMHRLKSICMPAGHLMIQIHICWLSSCAFLTLLSYWNKNNNNNLQAFQLIVFARYLLGVPEP